jgi:hypothetical protein
MERPKIVSHRFSAGRETFSVSAYCAFAGTGMVIKPSRWQVLAWNILQPVA